MLNVDMPDVADSPDPEKTTIFFAERAPDLSSCKFMAVLSVRVRFRELAERLGLVLVDVGGSSSSLTGSIVDDDAGMNFELRIRHHARGLCRHTGSLAGPWSARSSTSIASKAGHPWW